MITADDLDVLINTKDASEILGVAPTGIPYYVNKNRLPIAQKGSRGRGGGSWFRKADVLNLKQELEAAQAEEPTDGPLSRELKNACNDFYLKLSELTVMSLQADPYRRSTKSGHRDGQWCAEQIIRFVPHGTVHIRGLHYILVAQSGILLPDGTEYINNEKCFDFLNGASKDACWLGYVPFERIKDERNEAPQRFTPEFFAIAPKRWTIYSGEGVLVPDLNDAMPALSSDGSPNNPKQPYRICLIGEKSSLGDILAEVAESVQGELLLPTGELSDTMIAGCEADASRDGRPLVVLYFSDFDPSGFAMPYTCARKLQALRTLRGHEHLDIQVHAVALTLDQVKSLDLPSTPLKDGEKRKDKWIAAMRHEQTEIDALCALRPEVLRQIARDAVKPFYDSTLQSRWRTTYNEWRRETTEQFEAQPSYLEVQADIEAELESVQEAADRLDGVQEEAVQRLNNIVVPADFVEPQPEIDVDPPEPLFTTDDDFATATQKMKECRGYSLIDSE